MEATAKPGPKPLIWVGDSLEMVRSFPEAVRGEIGVALYEAQLGGKHDAAKPLRNIGSGILEVVADHRGDTLCAQIYLLHAFQKKSKTGIATPKPEIDLIKQRLKRAIEIHRAWEQQN